MPAPSTSARSRHERQQILQGLENDAASIRGKRPSFSQQLSDAARRDHATKERRQRARDYVDRAKVLRELADWVDHCGTEYQDAVLISLDLGGIYSGPDHAAPSVKDVERTTAWLTAELKKRSETSAKLAKWYRTATTQKPTQWGPATLNAVDRIVRQAREAFGENNWGRNVKPQQRAEYYAGLLCMDMGLLRSVRTGEREVIAGRVRKRLKRGQSLRQAAEALPVPSQSRRSV